MFTGNGMQCTDSVLGESQRVPEYNESTIYISKVLKPELSSIFTTNSLVADANSVSGILTLFKQTFHIGVFSMNS